MSKKLFTFIGDRQQLHAAARQMHAPSLLSGEIGLILCDDEQALRIEERLSVIGVEDLNLNQFFPGQTVTIESFFSFDKKQTVGKIERPGKKEKTLYKLVTLGADEAFNKFIKATGLKPASSSQYGGRARPLEPFSIHGQPMYNTFHIKGNFIVSDLDLFKRSLLNGVGGRKSYGFGLIMAKPCL